MCKTYGPPELRVRWEDDPEPYDPGDCDDAETWDAVETYGVLGCVVEIRLAACGCCGAHEWQHADSLWSIVGDDAYRAEIERDMVRHALA